MIVEQKKTHRCCMIKSCFGIYHTTNTQRERVYVFIKWKTLAEYFCSNMTRLCMTNIMIHVRQQHIHTYRVMFTWGDTFQYKADIQSLCYCCCCCCSCAYCLIVQNTMLFGLQHNHKCVIHLQNPYGCVCNNGGGGGITRRTLLHTSRVNRIFQYSHKVHNVTNLHHYHLPPITHYRNNSHTKKNP